MKNEMRLDLFRNSNGSQDTIEATYTLLGHYLDVCLCSMITHCISFIQTSQGCRDAETAVAAV